MGMTGAEDPARLLAEVRDAPRSVGGILRQLGPGLIIAGSVVGSGELIATTAAGAEAGFWLLWIILVGCVIKVFVQLEVGKHAVISGRSTLALLSSLPGWKPRGLHWIAWAALLMFLGGIGQMGGVVGGVGQSLAIAAPLSGTGRALNAQAEAQVRSSMDAVESEGAQKAGVSHSGEETKVDAGYDVHVWALFVTIVTVLLLLPGRYSLVERVVLVLVVGFTFISLLNFVMLQQHEQWAVSWAELGQGLRFSLPPAVDGLRPITTALAAFGIIGMAAGEIIFYPYWCLEKGYGRHVGPSDGSDAWADRAMGWIRVMRWDAWCSMVVYTVSTVAFYLLGAAVLGRAGLRPQGMDMIRTLAAMYEPVFGGIAVGMFLIGAVSVLFSTFFVNNASSALVWSDAIGRLRGAAGHDGEGTRRRALFVCLPIFAFCMFIVFPNPRAWVIFAGITQTLMLPLLGYAAVRLRWGESRKVFRGDRPGDGFLLLSAAVLAAVGIWLLLRIVTPFVNG